MSRSERAFVFTAQSLNARGFHYSSLSSRLITCGKQSVTLQKKKKKKEAQSLPEPVCLVVNENGCALPIIPLSFPVTTTRHSAHPRCGAWRWRASVLIWNEKKNVSTIAKKKEVIYLGTSLRCHIYPSKRQRSRQVTPDMSENLHRGGGIAVSIENRSNCPATQEF